MRLVFLSGGTGTPKLLLGFRELVDEKNFTIITNPGDDLYWNGLYVSPDFDTVVYLFAGKLDLDKFWGVKNDTFNALSVIKSLGGTSWFGIGDFDLGLHVWRTYLLSKGETLLEISEKIRRAWNISPLIIPPTNGSIQTKIKTPEKIMDFQEFWVKNKGEPEIIDVFYEKKDATLPSIVEKEINRSDAIIIGPSNPVSSITPILEVEGMGSLLLKNKDKVISVSPFIGEGVFSGPAAKMMKAKGYPPTSLGLAQFLGKFINTLVIHEKDKEMIPSIKRLVPRVIATDTFLNTAEKRLSLAKIILGLISK